MQDIKLVYSTADRPKLNSPHLICGFPGSGYVGKLAVDHLIQELHANHLVDIYSSSFPPQIMIKPDGTADLIKNSIFWWHGHEADLLLLTGDSQPANPDSEYALAEEVLGLAERFGTQQVFTLAAYITGVFVDKPKIFGTATDSETVKVLSSNNISIMDSGSITGMNGLV
nr:PAC2 family protein [Thermoproteota archaeon]